MKLSQSEKLELRECFQDNYPLIIKAINFAEHKHKGGVRDDGSPYFGHPLRVAEYVRHFKTSKNATMLYISALLHDTLEDTYTSYRELADKFGEQVASIVMELSTAKYAPKCIDGKAIYLSKKMQNMTSYALYIKLCDRLDNIVTLFSCTPEKIERILNDTRIIINYIQTNAKLNDAHKRVITAIEEEMKKY